MGCLVLIAMLGGLGLIRACSALFSSSPSNVPQQVKVQPQETIKAQEPLQAQSPATPQEQKWYEGGTLSKAGALTWQKASYKNKLATCGDIVSMLWNEKILKPDLQKRITSMDDLKYLAEELVKSLDIATAEESDPALNEKMYASQTVSDMSTAIIIAAGWVN